MIVTYNKNGKPTFKLNKNATDILVFECLECGGELFIENGIDGLRCYKCDGMIRPVGREKHTPYGIKVLSCCVDATCPTQRTRNSPREYF